MEERKKNVKRATCIGRDLSGEKGLWARFFFLFCPPPRWRHVYTVSLNSTCVLSAPSKNINLCQQKHIYQFFLQRSGGGTLGSFLACVFSPRPTGADSLAPGVRPFDPESLCHLLHGQSFVGFYLSPQTNFLFLWISNFYISPRAFCSSLFALKIAVFVRSQSAPLWMTRGCRLGIYGKWQQFCFSHKKMCPVYLLLCDVLICF